MLIDAHHHIWNPVTATPEVGYKWLRDIGAPKPFGDPTPIQRDYLVDEFLAEPAPARLAGSVHVQCDGALPDPVLETRFVAAEAAAAGHALAIVGLCDLSAPEVDDVLTRHMESPGFRGVRQIVSFLPDRPDISFAPRNYLADSAWARGLGRVAAAGLGFDLQLYPEQAGAAADLLARFPDMPVIVDHAGSPYRQDAAGLAAWGAAMRLLAALPQVTVKLSGWGMFDRAWNAPRIRPMVELLLDAFGPDRLMFGSNYPVERLVMPYPAMLAELRAALDGADDAAMAAIFGGTAARVYRMRDLQPGG